MLKRQIGKTGRAASIIGLGCEHIDNKPYEQVKEVIEAAISAEINIFDVFMPGKEVRENIAKALGSHRKEVQIQGHIGSTDIGQQYDISRDLPTVTKYFEDLLRIFNGHIEYGMLFFIDTEQNYRDVFDTPFADYAQKLKQNGDISHIGFSSHNPEIAIKAINTGLPEMLMFSVNPAFDMYPAESNVLTELENGLSPTTLHGVDPNRAALYKLCESKGIGITVMKSMGAGKLISPEHTPFKAPLTPIQCIHYALTRPAVSSVLIGCKSKEEVMEAVSYLNADEESLDYAPIISSIKNDFKGNCVYCNHCQPCPSEIDIASVTKYLDIAKLNEKEVPPTIREHYAALPHKASECISCGSCEEKCPFGVGIIENMQKAAEIFK